MYTHDALFAEVRKHLKKEKKILIYDADKHGSSKYGSLSEKEMIEAAKELVANLESAFIDAQTYKDRIPGWQWGARITYKLYNNTDGTHRIHITFPAKYLFRQSLWKDAGYTTHTGEGINDIFALFTQGYTSSKKMPAGWWDSAARRGEVDHIKAPNRWPAKPFVSNVVDEFEKKYPFIIVEYPEEWHS